MNRGRSRGTANCSRNPACKNFNGQKLEKFSNYFVKLKMDSSDSPYRNSLTEVKNGTLNDSATDLDDFKTPTAINKVSKVSKVGKNVKTTKRKVGPKNSLRKFVEDNFRHVDVNPDHLQMALALSESSYQAENPDAQRSSKEKMESFKDALKKYGFGYGKQKVSVEKKREISELVTKKNKKSRYRYVTPILKMRTEEERRDLISSKLTLILVQNQRTRSPNREIGDFALFSETLKTYQNSKIFKLNHMELEELNNSEKLYVKGLKVERCPSTCGSLLKDWSRIPGRVVSPQRHATPIISQSSTQRHAIRDRTRPCTPNHHAICVDTPTAPDAILATPPSRKSVAILATPTQLDATAHRAISPANQDREKDIGAPSPSTSYNLDQSLSPETPHDSSLVTFVSDDCFARKSLNVVNDVNAKESVKNSIFDSPQQNGYVIDLAAEKSSKTRNLGCHSSVIIEDLVSHSRSSREDHDTSFRSTSPDLFDSDDDSTQFAENCILNAETSCPIIRSSEESPKVTFNDEMECYDLTQSDDENEHSNLNVTDYVIDLLNSQKSLPPTKKFERISSSEESKLSQESIIYISDEELNYSSAYSTPQPKAGIRYDLFDGEKVSPEIEPHQSNCQLDLSQIRSHSLQTVDSNSPTISKFYFESPPNISSSHHPKSSPLKLTSPMKLTHFPHQPDFEVSPKLSPSPHQGASKLSFCDFAETPDAPADFIVKTSNVTPIANYDEMNTPEIAKELDKFGLKPLRRKRGVNLLKYIYDSTHPYVKDGDGNVVKKRKTESLVGQVLVEVEEELVFERTQSKRIASCRVPLHVVWHNFVMSNPKVRENILLYEPLQLEVLHSMLKDQGFKFNIQDLLTFLDRKCITVRTAQGKRNVNNR